jgi:glycerophosphoryl diester phosphodiesterase
VNLEIKIGLNDCKKTAESLALMMNKIYSIPPLSTPLISSFDWQSLLYFQDKYDKSATYALLSEGLPANYQHLLKKYNATDLHLSTDHVSESDVIEVKSHNIPLRLYTVNSVKLAKKWFALGVDAVFSDYPDKIMALFENNDLKTIK